MDPGNWATDIEGGARFGYMLIGHRGMNDLVFGQTVSAVRHAVEIPLLVVRSYGRERAQRTNPPPGGDWNPMPT